MTEPPCRHIASALLPWYLNGALGPDQHAVVREHVEGCDHCAIELDDLQEAAINAAPPAFTRESLHQPDSLSGPRHAQERRVWVLAVVLGVPAILGLVWVLVGVAKGR